MCIQQHVMIPIISPSVV